MTSQFDASYKKLFTNQEVVASLLQGFVPADILANIDLSTLEPLPSEHITKGNKERRNDLLWKARYGNAWCYLVIMLEFQSTEDWWMAVRVSEYSALLLRDVIQYGKLSKRDKLPLIFPIIIYNGDKKWQAPEEISQLLFEHTENIDIYQPHQKYYLLDIKRLPDFVEDMDNNLSMQIFNLENSPTVEDIINALANLAKILPEHEKLHIHEAFINLLSVNIIDDQNLSEHLVHCKTVQEAYNMFTQRMPLWKENLLNEGFAKGRQEGLTEGKEQGMEKGMERGILIGIKNSVHEILTSRFGSPAKESFAVIDKITNVNTLRALVIEAAAAESLNEFVEKANGKQ